MSVGKTLKRCNSMAVQGSPKHTFKDHSKQDISPQLLNDTAEQSINEFDSVKIDFKT